MTKLAPIEKFPLAVRKNIRDEWEAKKEEMTQMLSEVLGTEWTLDADLKQIYAYAQDGYAKESLGSCVANYFESGISRLREFTEAHDPQTTSDLNAIAHAHTLILDVDEDKRYTYNGVDVLDGTLRILFAPTYLGTNISDALNRDNIINALNQAPQPDDITATTALSFKARLAKRNEYDGDKIEEVRRQVGEALNKPDIVFTPNFEDNFAKLLAESKRKGNSLDGNYWEGNLAGVTLQYFDGLLSQLKWQKFNEDDLLQEGFNESVDKGEIAVRIVDKLKFASYCEVEIEDGVLYIQTKVDNWGTNLTDAASKIMDQL